MNDIKWLTAISITLATAMIPVYWLSLEYLNIVSLMFKGVL